MRSFANSSPAKTMPKKRLDLEEISSKVGISPNKIKEILWWLYREERIGNNELIRKSGLPKSVVRDLLKSLQPFLEKPTRFVVLNKDGQELTEAMIDQLIRKTPFSEKRAKNDLFIKLKSYHRKRLRPKRNLDQFPAATETILERALLIQEKGDLGGKEILLLGDYDLTSLALALIGGAKEIVVLDIDRQLLRTIDQIAQKEKFKIKSFYYDVKQPLLGVLKKSFDVIFSDPPYTPNGLRLFLARAVEAAKDDHSVFYFCYGFSDRARERGLEAQKIISQSGLLIEEKLKDFNLYRGAESIGSRSSLYVLKKTPKTKILIAGRFKGPIYTGIRKK